MHTCSGLCTVLQLTTALIRKAEEAVNGLIAKLGQQGSAADISQASPRTSVQQLLHHTRSLSLPISADTSAAGQDVGLASSSSDDLDTAADNIDAPLPTSDAQLDSHTQGRNQAPRKRHRADESDGDDHATSVRVRHSGKHQGDAATQTFALTAHPALAMPASLAAVNPASPAPAEATGSASLNQMRPTSPFAVAKAEVVAHVAAVLALPPALVPCMSTASGQDSDCLAPDGSFIGRAAAAGLPPNIMEQTRAALGLWEQLHETASTPSTVLPPVNRHAVRTVSVGTDNSAA